MIELENITKSYNGEAVLRGISLKIDDGEFLSVMGESGSGKSTLLNVMGGFLAPDGGRVLWRGEDISAFDGARVSRFRSEEMGFVFQSFRLISTLTAGENILLPAAVAGRDMRAARERAEELCHKLKLNGMTNKFPDQLSGGQQQRVAIARALICRPLAVVLDEPTGALDSAMQSTVMELLKDVNGGGTTIVQVTHSAAMAACGTRTVRIKDGAICG